MARWWQVARSRAGQARAEPVSAPGRYASRDEAIDPETGRLRPGFRWGTREEKGRIIRAG